jgi:uncharacterized protein with von Willebrand factor type A (vWA) domain
MNAALRIVEFCHVLRGLGVRISTSEMLDSAEALLQEDWTEPLQIRATLQATLIKRFEDIPVFREAFTAYFFERGKQCAVEKTANQLKHQQRLQLAKGELTFQGKGLNIPGELQDVYQRMAPNDQQRLRTFLDKTSNGYNVKTKFTPIVEKIVIGSLEYWRRQLAEEQEPTFPVRLSGDSAVDQTMELAARRLQPELQELLHKDMRRIGERDIPLVQRLIKQMAKDLSNKISRRHRLSHCAERLDLRRTIRHNLCYGGVMLQVKYKTATKSKPKILLLCDVSGSMAQYAVFVLQFVYGLSSLMANIESFIFAEDIERMTVNFRKRQVFADSMSEIMAKSAQWGQGTDLAKSLNSLCKDYRKVIHPSTVVIILSDTKTTRAEAAAVELAALKRNVSNIIWLNTLPDGEWSRHKTTELFQQHTCMVSCNTLADLAKIVRSKVFHLKV